MPKSGNVVIFDANMSLRLVLVALADHDAAPLWHPIQQRVVAVVSRNDLSDIAWFSQGTGELDDILDSYSVLTWRALCQRMESGGAPPLDVKGRQTATQLVKSKRHHPALSGFAKLGPDATLWDAVVMLRQFHVHHLPILEDSEQTCCYVITMRRIFDFLTLHFADDRRIFDQQVRDLSIGTFSGLLSVTPDVPLSSPMLLFEEHPVLSTLPVVDEAGRIINVLKRSMAFSAVDFSLPVSSFIDVKATLVHTAASDVTLFQLFVKFAETKAQCLYLVDADAKFIGLVTLAQVLDYFCAASATATA